MKAERFTNNKLYAKKTSCVRNDVKKISLLCLLYSWDTFRNRFVSVDNYCVMDGIQVWWVSVLLGHPCTSVQVLHRHHVAIWWSYRLMTNPIIEPSNCASAHSLSHVAKQACMYVYVHPGIAYWIFMEYKEHHRHPPSKRNITSTGLQPLKSGGQ